MTKRYKHWHLDTDDNNIVWCHFDRQGASTNVLSSGVLAEFDRIIEGIESTSPQGLIILSDKPNGFIAGADIVEFTAIKDRKQAHEIITGVHALFHRLDALTCPTLSLINGFCLGGGLELALACRYRVALDDPATRLGLPEVKLGIHPGFGGTARFIRLVGALPALSMMLAGRTVDARKAGKMGLVDRVVPERQFRNAAVALVRRSPPRHKPGLLKRLANHSLARPLLARFLRSELHKRVNPHHYPAPFALLDLWEKQGGDEQAMLAAEVESVADLITSEISRNLVRVYLLQDRLKSSGAVRDYRPQHVHVIGAGVMGGDIAAWCAYKGYNVTLQDRGPEYIAPAVKRAYRLFKKRLKAPNRVTAAMDRLSPDVRGLGITQADVIIEAIVEDAGVKTALFSQLEAGVKTDALLATNTSSIPLDEISQSLKQPERLVGMHFFNPVAQMQLVEIVHSAKTAPEWLDKASMFCRYIDRLPLAVASSPGFLVNRVLTPYLLETVILLEEGVPAASIDKVAKGFGMPMGPVELADTVGLDICLTVAENMAATTIDVTIPEKLRQMVDAGHLGRKSGKGFYEYHKGKPRKTATRLQVPDDLEDRLVLRLLNECAACLREQLVADTELLDAGMIFGTGFAPFRGGPLHYAGQRGYQAVVDRLIVLQEVHGDRFAPDRGWDLLMGN
ncbi:MAG: 3-hydroxyacyl-CoA dehydrogenase NAD-binding domain-containing protein [Gammaproteobacteria bacterium]